MNAESGWAVHRAAKLQYMTGETENMRIVVYIKKIVYDEDTVEGRSRKFFISKFDGTQVRGVAPAPRLPSRVNSRKMLEE
jgi:hypothetical protein